MKKIFFLMFLFLIPIIYAQEENYNNYSSLNIKVKIGSEINVNYLKEDAKLDNINVFLSYFPRENHRQSILNQEFSSEPLAEVSVDNNINYEWDDVTIDEFSFELNTDVKTINTFNKIENKINFPIRDLGDDLNEYVKATEFIDINDAIREKAASIVEGETDLYIAVYKLADWVNQNVEYDLNTLTAEVVQKSSWVLENKEGVCDEITNLFISMARSVGIPARFVSGLVYSNVGYKFSTHGWAEVYFPGYGWVPFDVTFGQYGWISPEHVKLNEANDSKTASVSYEWKSYGVELDISELSLDAEIVGKGEKVSPLSKLEVKPLKKEVKFGSYVPLEVIVENLQNYYLPLTVYVGKAPGLLDSNVKRIVLRPKEKRSVYFILEIPDLNDNFLYSSIIEAETDFGASDKGEIYYSKFYEFYDLDWANSFVDEFKQEEKDYFTDINIDCYSDKNDYYFNDLVNVKCDLKNIGNINLIFNACLDKCEIINLNIAEEKKVEFNLSADKERLVIKAENNDFAKNYYLDINVVMVPEVNIIDFRPDKTSYYEEGEIFFTINGSSMIKSPVLLINDKFELKLNDFSRDYDVKLKINGKDILEDKIKINLNYKDELNESYENEFAFNVKVIDTPFYAKIKNWFLANVNKLTKAVSNF